MLIPSSRNAQREGGASLSRRVNANSQLTPAFDDVNAKLIKKGEC